jgi:hypothetical protein
MSYENETCEGCARFNDTCLLVQDGRALTHTQACDRFVPSLQCRHVRALEAIVELLGEGPKLLGPVDPSWCEGFGD